MDYLVYIIFLDNYHLPHGFVQYPFNPLFGDGAYTELNAEHDYSNWLPSLNVKVELTDELLLRFAAAKAMARPNFADLGANITLSANLTSEGEASQDAGNPPQVQDYELTLDSTQNPYLDPMESTQFDVSLEWYYAECGRCIGSKKSGFSKSRFHCKPASSLKLAQTEPFLDVNSQIS